MTLDQLLIELDELKTPLLVKRSNAAMQRVFDLYRVVAGREPRGSGCYMCAVDSYYEMKRISQIGEGWDNSVNLPNTLIINEPKLIIRMEKYKLTRKSFRVFGSPDTITEDNTSDAEVEALLASNPTLSKFFVLRESGEKVEAPKGTRKRRTKAEIEAEKAAEEQARIEAEEASKAESAEVKEETAEGETEKAPEVEAPSAEVEIETPPQECSETPEVEETQS